MRPWSQETAMCRHADHHLTNFEYTGFFSFLFFYYIKENIMHHLRNW